MPYIAEITRELPSGAAYAQGRGYSLDVTRQLVTWECARIHRSTTALTHERPFQKTVRVSLWWQVAYAHDVGVLVLRIRVYKLSTLLVPSHYISFDSDI